VPVRELVVERPSLEEVFLALTGSGAGVIARAGSAPEAAESASGSPGEAPEVPDAPG
jgi:hypothetical protein